METQVIYIKSTMNTPMKTSIELPEIMKSTHTSTADDAMHSPHTSLVISTSYLADDYVSADSSVIASPLSLTEEKENQVQVPIAPRNLYAGLLSPSNKPRHSPIGTLTNKFVAKAPSPLAEVKPNRNEQLVLPYPSRVLCRPGVTGVSRFSPSTPTRWPFDEQTQVNVAKEAIPHILAMGYDGSDTSSLDIYKSEDGSVDASIADDDEFYHSSSSAGLSNSAGGVSIVDHESTATSTASFSDDASTRSVDDANHDAPMTTDKSTQITHPLILQPFVKKESSDDDEALKYSSSSDGLSNLADGVSGVEHGRTDTSDATFSDDPSTTSVGGAAEDSPTPFVEPVENCFADQSTQMSRPNIDQEPVNSASTIKKELGYDGEDLDDPIDKVAMADNSTQMARPLIPQPIKEKLSDDDEALKSIIIGSNGFVEIQFVPTESNSSNKQDEEVNGEASFSSKQMSLGVHASPSTQHQDPESLGDHSSISSSTHSKNVSELIDDEEGGGATFSNDSRSLSGLYSTQSRNTSELIDKEEGGGATFFSDGRSLSGFLVSMQKSFCGDETNNSDISSEPLNMHEIPSANVKEGAEASSVKSDASKLCESSSNEDGVGAQHDNGENENSMNSIDEIWQFAPRNNSIGTYSCCSADSDTFARDDAGDSFGCYEEEQSNQFNESTTTSIPKNCIRAAYFKLYDANQQLVKENIELQSNVEEVNSQNDVLAKEVGTVKAERDSLTGHVCTLQALLSKLMSEEAQLEQELEESRGCNDALTSENASFKSNLVRAGIQRDALDNILIKHEVEMEAIEQEKAVLEIKLDTIHGERGGLCRKAEELNGVVNNLSEEKERLEEECMSHKVELTRLEMVTDRMEVELYFANQKEAEFADNVSKLTREKAQLEKQCDALAIALGKCNDEIETLKKENTIPFEVAIGVGDSYDSAGDNDGDESCSYNSASEISGWSGWEALLADYGKLKKKLGDATKENEQLQALVDIDNATTLLDLKNENEELQANVKMLATKNIKLTDHIDLYRSCFVEDSGSTSDIVTSLYKHRARLMHEIEVTDKVIQDHESRIKTL